MPRYDRRSRKRAPREPYTRGKNKFHAPYPLQKLNTDRTAARQALYRDTLESDGVVLCYVCGKPVAPDDATLEHIIPLAVAGDDHPDNLAISHALCNQARGDALNRTLQRRRTRETGRRAGK